MNVLSLFDGIACCRVALRRAGIPVHTYYSSEIDKYAMKVALHNHPHNMVQLGDINGYKTWQLPKIDLITAGSPCQDLSRIKSKDGKGLHGEKSKLFFKFVECLHLFKPKYFLLENVVMDKESEDLITAILGVDPILINSSHFSAQDRPRVYWTNIPFDKELPNNETVFRDIAENEVPEKYFYKDEFESFDQTKRMIGNLKRFTDEGKRRFMETSSRVYNPNFKMATLTAVSGGHQEKKVFVNGRVRKATPLEYERLQTLPDGYTDCVSDSQRYKSLGNGWTVDVIAHIFKGLKSND